MLIRGGRIERISPVIEADPSGIDARIDARERVVCPGFIDLHSHGDLVLALEDDDLRMRLAGGRVAQGITTEIVGNCGMGPWPLSREHEPDLRGILAWMTPADYPWDWLDAGGYLRRLESLALPVNVGTLAAHGALRLAEAGPARSLPRVDSISAMRRSLEWSLDAGAFGMSLGLIYPPGSFTPTSEIEPLAEILARRGAMLTAHVRGSSETLLPAVDEILSLGRLTGVRVHHSHSEAVGRAFWAGIPRVLEVEERARREGVRVTYDMFPYTAAATTMAAIYPPWSLQGGVWALIGRLRDTGTRGKIRRDIETVEPTWPPWGEDGWAHNLVRAVGWERITVGTVATGSGRWAEGLDLGALGARRGIDPFDAISDLMIDQEGRVSQIIHGISGEDGDDGGLVALLTDPHGAVCTDANDTGRGRPHPAAYGAYPLVLGTFVRERRVLALEEAIRKMTSYPASILGLEDRGVVREGAAADLVVFDPASIGSEAGYVEPRRIATGIDAVIVNGGIVVRSGALTGERPGVVLRRG
jgi:N-acyl-D-aspartate/D-glutamate deacylase